MSDSPISHSAVHGHSMRGWVLSMCGSVLSSPEPGARRSPTLSTRRSGSIDTSAAILIALAALALPGCDNPACVFGGTCNPDGVGGSAGNQPQQPFDHAWLRDGAPSVQRSFPSGVGASLQTPIVLVFSESMAASSFAQALELGSANFPAQPIAASSLIADGRMWVGSSAIPLTASTEYELRVVENRVLTDLQGAALPVPADRVLARFTTAAANSTAPRIVATFPADFATQQSATGEIVVVFDRAMNPASFNTTSFAVTVDGATPADNPEPRPLTIAGAASDTRVWRYRSADPNGVATPFANSAMVEVELSPTSAPLLPASGTNALPNTVFEYTTAAVGAPLSAQLTSTPMDAIGLANLDGTTPLEIGIETSGAQIGDTLRIYVFGETRTDPARDTLLGRSATLDVTLLDVLNQIATVGEAQVDLASSASPVALRVAEGTLAIGFAVQRGAYQSPVRMLDVDDLALGPQGPVLDVTPPTLTGLSTSGTVTTSFTSDQRDVVVVGRASERIRACEVIIVGGPTNGVQPPVVASDAQGLFIAAPVTVGQIDPATQPLSTRVWIFDRALNRSVNSALADVRQVGGVGPGAALPGAPQIEVEVRDARTLAPINNALVITHEDLGATVPVVAFGTTGALGRVTLNAGLVGDALVTVDAVGYHLVTVHGLRSARVSLLVERIADAPSVMTGALSTSVNALSSLDNLLADTRVIDGAEKWLAVANCSSAGTALLCPYGPAPIRAGPLGAVTAFATDPPPSAFNFTAAGFLRAFGAQFPLPSATPAAPAVTSITISGLLDDPDVALEERVLAGPAATFNAAGISGVVLSQLDGDPRVSIEGSIPGVAGPVTVGVGIALDPTGSPANAWQIRSAIPGAVDPTDGKYPGDEIGALFQEGTLSGGLFLRVELRDDIGGRSVLRQPYVGAPGALTPPDAPVVLSPTLGSVTAGPEYDVTFTDSLPGGTPQGVYRVTLVGAGGRRWTLWRPDGVAATRTVRVPGILAAGGTPLGSGSVAASVRAFGYPSFDASQFLFSDLERSARAVADGAPGVFSQP